MILKLLKMRKLTMYRAFDGMLSESADEIRLHEIALKSVTAAQEACHPSDGILKRGEYVRHNPEDVIKARKILYEGIRIDFPDLPILDSFFVDENADKIRSAYLKILSKATYWTSPELFEFVRLFMSTSDEGIEDFAPSERLDCDYTREKEVKECEFSVRRYVTMDKCDIRLTKEFFNKNGFEVYISKEEENSFQAVWKSKDMKERIRVLGFSDGQFFLDAECQDNGWNCEIKHPVRYEQDVIDSVNAIGLKGLQFDQSSTYIP